MVQSLAMISGVSRISWLPLRRPTNGSSCVPWRRSHGPLVIFSRISSNIFTTVHGTRASLWGSTARHRSVARVDRAFESSIVAGRWSVVVSTLRGTVVGLTIRGAGPGGLRIWSDWQSMRRSAHWWPLVRGSVIGPGSYGRGMARWSRRTPNGCVAAPLLLRWG